MNFGQAARSFRKLNPHLFAKEVTSDGWRVPRKKKSPQGSNPVTRHPSPVTLILLGQVSGGKNNLIITRKGNRFPRRPKKGQPSAWERWKRSAIDQIERQLPADFTPIDHPQNLRLDYWKVDERVRDQPMVLDALFHVLEKAGVVTNDTLLWVTESSRALDRENPRVVLTFL